MGKSSPTCVSANHVNDNNIFIIIQKDFYACINVNVSLLTFTMSSCVLGNFLFVVLDFILYTAQAMFQLKIYPLPLCTTWDVSVFYYNHDILILYIHIHCSIIGPMS